MILTEFPLNVKMKSHQTAKCLLTFTVEMNVGDTVEVSVPAGDFHLDTESTESSDTYQWWCWYHANDEHV